MKNVDDQRRMLALQLFHHNTLPATSLATLMALLLSACGGGSDGGGAKDPVTIDGDDYLASKIYAFDDQNNDGDAIVYVLMPLPEDAVTLSEAPTMIVKEGVQKWEPVYVGSYTNEALEELAADDEDSTVIYDQIDLSKAQSTLAFVLSPVIERHYKDEALTVSFQLSGSDEVTLSGDKIDSSTILLFSEEKFEWLEESTDISFIAIFNTNIIDDYDSTSTEDYTGNIIFNSTMPVGMELIYKLYDSDNNVRVGNYEHLDTTVNHTVEDQSISYFTVEQAVLSSLEQLTYTLRVEENIGQVNEVEFSHTEVFTVY